MGRVIKVIFMIFLTYFGVVNTVFAAESTSANSVAEKVIVGAYPMGIMGLAPRDGELSMSFYLWYKAKSADFKPDVIEILNSPDALVTNTSSGKNGDEYFTTQHYQATLFHNWDYTYFPFDRQVFNIVLEGSEPIGSLVLVPDTKQSHMNSNIVLAGWTAVKPVVISSKAVKYNTDFGDNSATANTYSRVTFSYVYKHNGWRLFINLFGAFFVCGFFCIITSFFEDPDVRLQLILAAVIGFIGNKYILDTTIPEVTQFTLSDAIQVATIVTMVLALMGLLFAGSVAEDKRKKVNAIVAGVTTFGYIGYVAYYLILAINS